MSMNDTLTVGPLNLPVRYLVFALSAAVGYAVIVLLLRRRPELRRLTTNRFLNSVFTFVLVWKLQPLAEALISVLSGGPADGVWLSVFIPGGLWGAVAGAAAALAYLVVSVALQERRGSERATEASQKAPGAPAAAPTRVGRLRQLLVVTLGLLPTLAVYLAASVALGPRESPAPLTASRQIGTDHRGFGSEVGNRAPAFTAAALGGGSVRFDGSPGPVIVLNFWATWCPPCRAELPDLVGFSTESQSKDIVVWGIDMTSTESSLATVREFVHARRIDFPILLDSEGSIAKTYGVTALPTTFIIGRDGTILAKQVGAMSPSWLRAQAARASR